jgi:hypothetical protein
MRLFFRKYHVGEAVAVESFVTRLYFVAESQNLDAQRVTDGSVDAAGEANHGRCGHAHRHSGGETGSNTHQWSHCVGLVVMECVRHCFW